MSIIIAQNDLKDQLTGAIARFKPGPVLLHTDLLRVGIMDKMKPRDEICREYEDLLLDLLGARELLIPTFNYGFCRDGEYDLAASPGQVGALTEYVARRYPHLRTRTPVFNFCILNNKRFGRKEAANPFGPDSTFAELRSLGGTVAFLGASFDSNTFLHFVEESVPVTYRYIKVFEGTITEGDDRAPWKLDYRVRPMLEGAAVYDWERLQHDLRQADILHEAPAGNGRLLWYHTVALFDFWFSRMKADPFYLLTEDSRRLARDLFARFGEPLTFEAVEGSAG